MNITKKIFLVGLLSFGIFFTSGCDNVSYEISEIVADK